VHQASTPIVDPGQEDCPSSILSPRAWMTHGHIDLINRRRRRIVRMGKRKTPRKRSFAFFHPFAFSCPSHHPAEASLFSFQVNYRKCQGSRKKPVSSTPIPPKPNRDHPLACCRAWRRASIPIWIPAPARSDSPFFSNHSPPYTHLIHFAAVPQFFSYPLFPSLWSYTLSGAYA
jgi:hypothetical protein